MTTRRNARSARRRPTQQPDPGVAFGATYAWRADDAAVSAGKTATLVPYLGAVALPWSALVSTNQPVQPAIVSAMNGRVAVRFADGHTDSGYTGTVPLGESVSVLSVVRLTVAGGNGFMCSSDTGAVNRGILQFQDGAAGVTSRRAGQTDATNASALTPPGNLVALSVWPAAAVPRAYYNSITATLGTGTTPTAARTGPSLQIGMIDNVGTYALAGYWACTVIWNRALAQAEAAAVVTYYASRYGATLT